MTEELIRMLKDTGMLKINEENEEPFRLKHGRRSRLFIDMKEANLHPKILSRTIDIILNTRLDEWYNIEFDIIGSVAIGGVPYASIYSYVTEIPHIIVRLEKHASGIENHIIGDNGKGNLKGKWVLLIEDVATTGGSIVNAAKAIRETGALCHDCIVIVDREEGAEELCNNNYINLYSIIKKSNFGIKQEI